MAAQSFLAGFIIAAILSGVVVLFAFPEILDSESSEGDKSSILQRKLVTTSSEAYIGDVNTTEWIDVPDMNAIITTTGNSFLVLGFSTPYALQMGSGFTGSLRFNISLEVKGIGGHQGRIGYYSGSAISALTEVHSTFYLNFETDVLPASNYSIGVAWICVYDVPGNNYLYFSYTVNFNFTRILSVWEIQA